MKKKIKNIFPLIGISLLMPVALQAKVVLPQFITDNMVVQQSSELTLPVKSNPNAVVTVLPSWTSKVYETTTDDKGEAIIKIKTPKAGGSYSITFDDGEITKLDNIMSGEVWLCSGQSNMEMPVGGWGKVMNYEKEIAAANYPNIRLLQVQKTVGYVPAGDVAVNMGGWRECSPETVAEFSSIAYFFARELSAKLNVPIGVIDTTWGGTPAEAWTGYETMLGVEGFEKELSRMERCNFSQEDMAVDYERELNEWMALANKENGAFEIADYNETLPVMPVPGLWENSKLPGFDGIVWMQYRFDVPVGCEGKSMKLHLGMIDDEDITYLNGIQIAKGSGYNSQRVYEVPAELVKSGNSVISVRVSDFGGEGGIHGSPSDFYAEVDGKRIPLHGDWRYYIAADFSKLPTKPISVGSSSYPTVLYNAMLHPLHVLPVKGFLWYQGCANVGREEQYADMFPAMIENWRELWNDDDLPFYFVQLAGFLQPRKVQPDSEWAALRNAQAVALSLDNTAMAVAIDLGDPNDIHPKNKQEVARRLSLIALNRDYGKKCEYRAPEVKKSHFAGDCVVLSFDKPVKSLANNVTGFIVGDAQGRYVSADVKVLSERKIELRATGMERIEHVKYNWADYPDGNIVGVSSNLPVAPFKIDK